MEPFSLSHAAQMVLDSIDNHTDAALSNAEKADKAIVECFDVRQGGN